VSLSVVESISSSSFKADSFLFDFMIIKNTIKRNTKRMAVNISINNLQTNSSTNLPGLNAF